MNEEQFDKAWAYLGEQIAEKDGEYIVNYQIGSMCD
jgi:hypothetical protein